MPDPTSTARRLTLAAIAVVLVGAGVVGGYAWGHRGDGDETSVTVVAPRASATGHNAADVDFAQTMLPHHEQALAMAKLAATRAGSDQVTSLAAQIAGAQKPEIDTMRGWLDRWGAEAGWDRMTGMMSEADLSRLATLSGADFDHEFLTMMVQHHDGAIDMAREELDHGENGDALALAASISVTQRAQADQMRALLVGSQAQTPPG